MDAFELKHLLRQGESTFMQFKERVNDAYKVGCELVAFSNAQGGRLIVGVSDKTGEIKGLSFREIQETNALLSNAASENVKPAILIETEIVCLDGQNVVVATIPKGKDKPYKDNKGIVWTKNGADKRKVFSNDELRVMLQSCGGLFADKDEVDNTSYSDISEPILKRFLYEKYTQECINAGIKHTDLQEITIELLVKAIEPNFTIDKLLKNLNLMTTNGCLTLAGLLLLGKNILKYRPLFTVKGISFVGNTIAGTEYRDKLQDRELETNLLGQYNATMSFINRNLRSIQVDDEFNSLPQLEIPQSVFVELLVNAFIHRDYYQNASIKVFIFDDRIEIVSPGILPDSVTETALKQGISKPRNQLLFDNARFLLPYTGIGSGIIRAIQNYSFISFENNYNTEEFKIIMLRLKDFNSITPQKTEDTPQKTEDITPQKIEDTPQKTLSDRILEVLVVDPKMSQKQISKKLGISFYTVKEYINKLKSEGLIERVGSAKGGYWKLRVENFCNKLK